MSESTDASQDAPPSTTQALLLIIFNAMVFTLDVYIIFLIYEEDHFQHIVPAEQHRHRVMMLDGADDGGPRYEPVRLEDTRRADVSIGAPDAQYVIEDVINHEVTSLSDDTDISEGEDSDDERIQPVGDSYDDDWEEWNRLLSELDEVNEEVEAQLDDVESGGADGDADE
ncbi:MAG: hypothetical protein M1817_001427 [Caeruleum heppii]|nr:MAG: hypothetical protein M1817_001427 [Caeruleum heppii]